MRPASRNGPACPVTSRSRHSRIGRGRRGGYSLIETMSVMVILGILTSIAVPRFGRSLERAKADVAVANLRAVWAAERIYWLENRRFTSDLSTFVDRSDTPQFHGLLERSIVHGAVNSPYSYHVSEASAMTFTASATRTAGGSWSGTFTIDQDGTFDENSRLQCEGEPDIVLGLQ